MSGVGKGIGTALASLLAVAAPLRAQMAAPASDLPPAAAAATITAADLRHSIGVLADDSMRGRDTPSPELMEAARFVAHGFEAAGLQPGWNGEWLQLYPITLIRPGPAEDQELTITGPDGTTTPAWGEQWFAYLQAASTAGEGQVVVVSDPASLPDVDGKFVLVRVTPENVRDVLGGSLARSLESVSPAGILVSMDMPDAFFSQIRGFLSGPQTRLGELDEQGTPAAFIAQSALPPSLAEALVGGTPVEGWTVRLRTRAEIEMEKAPNTVGILPGSDPALKDEYVLFTAHMDHVGVGRAVEGDSIYNGADDDASGTATLIELAQAFARTEPRPRRSLVFVAVSGEEKGLFGSSWYAEHPAVPLDQTVADINMDMVGRNWQDTIVAIGKQESSLGPTVDSVAAAHPELDMAVIDDIWPEEHFYSRSDHYNFARRGVPILFFFNGTHEDYHRPSDEPARIEYDKTARIGRLVYWLGLDVANADQRPVWDPEAYQRVVEGDGD